MIYLNVILLCLLIAMIVDRVQLSQKLNVLRAEAKSHRSLKGGD